MPKVTDFSVLEELPWTDDIHIQNQKERRSMTGNNLTKELSSRRNPNTPDFLELKNRGDNLVFVYGTLRTGNPNFYLLEGSKYLGYATTTIPGFIMRSGKGFPMVKRADKENQLRGKILGEVFAVDALTMCELDRLEGNNFFYKREEVFCTLQEQDVPMKEHKTFKPACKAWMYLIPQEDTSLDSWLLSSVYKTKLPNGTESRVYEWHQPKDFYPHH